MPKKLMFIFGGAIGDALLGVQLAHTLEAAGSQSRLTLVSTRKNDFIRELIATVPRIEYRELVRTDIRSWIALLGLAFSPHGVVFLEPFQDTVSQWWKLIARAATLAPGSIEVRCQSRRQPAPARVRVLAYNPKTDHLFSVITRVASLWGAPTGEEPVPSLPTPACPPAPAKPYILFHFFAGAYRRSFPLEKVRPLLLAARERFPAHEFVLTCARQEETAARRMVEGIADARVEIHPYAQRMLCLLKQSSACVGVASGIALIATHLQVPAVILCNLSDPCWLPTYAKKAVLLSAREHCGCNGDKTGECNIQTPGGGVYRCLYDIQTESILSGMKDMVRPHPL